MGKITLTSSVGNFIFDCPVALSKAKLIRDSILGQCYNPSAGTPKIKSVDSAVNYIQHHVAGSLKDVPFELVFK